MPLSLETHNIKSVGQYSGFDSASLWQLLGTKVNAIKAMNQSWDWENLGRRKYICFQLLLTDNACASAQICSAISLL